MDLMIKLNSQVNGKDKIARLLQYSCRAIWDSLNASHETNVALITKLKSLEYLLSSFRKLLRFGKSVEVFQGAFSSINYQDSIIALTLTLSKISQALFLLTDHIIWLARTGIFKNIDTQKWTTRSNKYWVVSLVMNIVRDVYELNRLVSCYTPYKNILSCTTHSLISIRSTADISRFYSSTSKFLHIYRNITVDTLKNCCDLLIPLTSLGYIKLNPRTIGILGVVSSVAGILVVLEPQKYKLTP